VSVGAVPTKVEFVPAGKTASANGRTFDGPINIARRTVLKEISFTPLAADDNTSVAIAANRRNGQTMDPISDTTDTVLDEDPITQERERAAKIVKACARFTSMDSRKRDEIQAKALGDGWTVDATELALLRADRRPTSSGNTRRGGFPDEGRIIEASMCLSCGLDENVLGKHYDANTPDAAVSQPFRNASLHTLIRATIRAAGRPVPERIDDEALRTYFEADRFLRASETGGFSTLSISNVLANTQNKYLLQTYSSVATTWRLWCATSDLKDFKPGVRVRLIGTGHFQEVPVAGEIKSMGLQDQGFAIQAKTEGAIITTGRQDLINDDLGALMATPKILGRAAAIALEKACYTALLGNAGSFFGAGNSNYLSGAGSVLSIAGVTSAEALFLKQVDPNGDPTLIIPRILLTPPELAVTGAMITRSEEIRDTTSSKNYTTTNPHAGRFTAASSPWLSNSGISGNSALAWYLLTDVTSIAAAEVGVVAGQRAPTIQTAEANFNTLGISTRAFFDFGVSLQDPRAGVLSAGT
jgi:hypothetical protein